MNPNTPKMGGSPFIGFRDMVFTSQVFGMQELTDSLMHKHTRECHQHRRHKSEKVEPITPPGQTDHRDIN